MCTAAWQARSAAHSAMVASFGAPPFLHTRCSQRGRSVLLHLPPLAGLHRQGVHLLCQVIYNRRVCQFWTAADCSWVWATRTASCSTGCLCKRRLLHVLLSTCLPYLRDTFFGPSAHTLNRPAPPCSTAPYLRCSVQGYGPKAPGYPAFVYPGSGATCDTKLLAEAKAAAEAQAAAEAAAAAAAAAAEAAAGQQNGIAPAAMDVDGPQASGAAVKSEPGAPASATAGVNGGAAQPAAAPAGQAAAAPPAGAAAGQEGSSIEEDPDHEFEYKGEAPLFTVA